MKTLLKSLSKKVGLYPLAQKANFARVQFMDNWQYPVLRQLEQLGFDRELIRVYSEEFDWLHIWQDIQSELAKRGMCYQAGVSGWNDLRRLYVICRLSKPSVVVETGVASGASSLAILTALSVNGSGLLYSIDLPKQITEDGVICAEGKSPGWLVPERFYDRWLLTLGDSQVELLKLVTRIGDVDVFYHDSLHTYHHMLWEFIHVWPFLKRGGLLFADDADKNRAIHDFAAVTCRPYKIWRGFGIIRK